MHEEQWEVPPETARAINAARARGGRIVAVGTTSVRTLESAATPEGVIEPARGATRLMIAPGYRWRLVDAIITNFHLPRSTLLCLVAAATGRDRLLELYREAVEQHYQFYSYGDAMLLLPRADHADHQGR
jgi:S-adenosylmethionine:tRNA ribosyltransferase-isomerase